MYCKSQVHCMGEIFKYSLSPFCLQMSRQSFEAFMRELKKTYHTVFNGIFTGGSLENGMHFYAEVISASWSVTRGPLIAFACTDTREMSMSLHTWGGIGAFESHGALRFGTKRDICQNVLEWSDVVQWTPSMRGQFLGRNSLSNFLVEKSATLRGNSFPSLKLVCIEDF